MYGGLWAAHGTQGPEANQPSDDQVDGDEVIEKAWENQNENPHDERNEG
jgi:hypothetical protein